MILGGMALIKQVLHLGDRFLIAFLALSSTAFITVFGICLWQIIVISRAGKRGREKASDGQFDTNQLAEQQSQKSLEEAPSVVDETTRSLEAIPKENAIR
jgi:hypothetical protein